MRAIRFHEYGGPEVLCYEECDTTRPRAGEVLVEIEAAGVNPLDWHIRSGRNPLRSVQYLPAVPGTDFAGRVTAIGAGVRNFVPGDRVFGQCELLGHGSYAEQVPVRCSRLALMPPGLGFTRAASLPSIGLLAWQALFEFGELSSGQRLLIAGASGCVAYLLVQLAQLVADVHVAALCPRKRWNDPMVELCGELIDSADELAAARLRGRFDLVINLWGEPFETTAIAAARRGGRLVTAAAFPDFVRCAARRVRAIGLPDRFSREQLEMVARLVLGRQLQTPPLRIEHMAEAAAVHRLGERRMLRGKAILVPG